METISAQNVEKVPANYLKMYPAMSVYILIVLYNPTPLKTGQNSCFGQSVNLAELTFTCPVNSISDRGIKREKNEKKSIRNAY